MFVPFASVSVRFLLFVDGAGFVLGSGSFFVTTAIVGFTLSTLSFSDVVAVDAVAAGLAAGFEEKNDEIAERPDATGLPFFGLSFFTGLFFSSLTVLAGAAAAVSGEVALTAGFFSGVVFSFLG